MGEIIFWIFIGCIVLAILQKFFESSKVEKDEENAMRLRLEDPYIYEPETGVKLTLEEAESGNWIGHDNENRIRSAEEIEKYYSGYEKTLEDISNHIKATGESFQKLTEEDIKILDNIHLLSKYDSWSYSHSFNYKIGNCRVIFPQVVYEGNLHNPSFSGVQFLFWLKVNDVSGHYFLRNKNLHEKAFDLINLDDAFRIRGFEVFTIKECKNVIPIIHLLKSFENEENLELEISGENFFIKTVDEPTKNRFLHLENIVKNVC